MNPANARAKLTWTSDNSEIATVLAGDEGTATVTLKNPGTTTITVKTDNGLSDTSVVSIKTVKSFSIVGGYQEWYDPNDPYKYDYDDGTNDGKIILDVIYSDDAAQRIKVKQTDKNIRLPDEWNKLSSPNTPAAGSVNIGGTVEASEVKSIGFTYGGVKQNFNITVRAPRLLTVVGVPKQLVYGIGEKFNPDGLALTAIYNVGPNKTIPMPDNIKIVPSDWNTIAGTNASSSGGQQDEGRIFIKHFVYNDMVTQASTNIASVNGQAGINNGSRRPAGNGGGYVGNTVDHENPNPLSYDNGVRLARFVAVLDDGVTRIGDLRYTLPQLFEQVRGKKATIYMYGNSIDAPAGGIVNAIALDDPKSDITVIGKEGMRTIGGSTEPSTIFRVGNGAKLTLGTDITVSNTHAEARSMIVVDKDGKFDMLGGSVLTGFETWVAEDIAPLVVRAGGVATINRDVRIFGNSIDIGGGNTIKTYNSATGVLVNYGGKLIMDGGIVGPSPAIYQNGTRGEVTVHGELELGGNAYITRLFLIAPNGVFSRPVIIKDTWVPDNTIRLFMGAPSVNTTGEAELLFKTPDNNPNPLFKSAGGAALSAGTMAKFNGFSNTGTDYPFLYGGAPGIQSDNPSVALTLVGNATIAGGHLREE